MVFIALVVALAIIGVVVGLKLSPYTEKLMGYIWTDPAKKAKLKLAMRVKELCIDGDMSRDTATMMIAREEGLMEEQVDEMMRSVTADPTILKMALGGRAGNAVYQGLRKLNGEGYDD